MPAKKIQDEGEVVRWFAEGRTYEWMSAEYLRKYDIVMTLAAWGNFRRRRGLERRITRDDELIPWAVELRHRGLYPVQMLRAEARRRAGMPLREGAARELKAWLDRMSEQDLVVDYDGNSEAGWSYVRRRHGRDVDLIRRPDRVTTTRKNADTRAS